MPKYRFQTSGSLHRHFFPDREEAREVYDGLNPPRYTIRFPTRRVILRTRRYGSTTRQDRLCNEFTQHSGGSEGPAPLPSGVSLEPVFRLIAICQLLIAPGVGKQSISAPSLRRRPGVPRKPDFGFLGWRSARRRSRSAQDLVTLSTNFPVHAEIA